MDAPSDFGIFRLKVTKYKQNTNMKDITFH